VSSSINFAISFQETRGNLGISTALTTLTSNISNVTTTLSGPTLTANNYGNTVGNPLNSLSISSNFIDSYNSSFNYNKGFYFQGDLTLTSGLFVASPNPITLNINQVYSSPQPVGSSSSTSSNVFYYDSVTGSPTNSSYNLALTSGTFSQLSGIWVQTGTSNWIVTGSTDNLGNYFYQNPMLSYSVVSLANETLLSSQTGGTNQVVTGITDDHFDTTLTFSITGTTSVPTQFAKGVSLSITPQNINSVGSPASSSNNIIIDTRSDLSNRRENADIGSTAVLEEYDESQSILGTTDLQCVNGSVCTKITGVSYLDYTQYWYYSGSLQKNSLDYSSITSGTRYVTVQQQYTPRTNPYTQIQLVINGSNLASFNPVTSIYYRSINTTNSTPTGSTNISSYWVNGTPGSTGTQLTGGNYANPSLSLIGWYNTITLSPTQISGNLYFPGGTSIQGNANYYLYVQIGLEISFPNIKISSIQINIS
jgi:hypothetical protein